MLLLKVICSTIFIVLSSSAFADKLCGSTYKTSNRNGMAQYHVKSNEWTNNLYTIVPLNQEVATALTQLKGKGETICFEGTEIIQVVGPYQFPVQSWYVFAVLK